MDLDPKAPGVFLLKPDPVFSLGSDPNLSHLNLNPDPGHHHLDPSPAGSATLVERTNINGKGKEFIACVNFTMSRHGTRKAGTVPGSVPITEKVYIPSPWYRSTYCISKKS